MSKSSRHDTGSCVCFSRSASCTRTCWSAVRPDAEHAGQRGRQMRCERPQTDRNRRHCAVVATAHCATCIHRNAAGAQQLREIGPWDGDLKLRECTSACQLRRWLVVLRSGKVPPSAAPPIYAYTPRRGLRVGGQISSLTTFPVGYRGSFVHGRSRLRTPRRAGVAEVVTARFSA